LEEFLITVGAGDQQVTASSFGLRAIEIPEYFFLLNKSGLQQLKYIRIYDAWWRLFRNLGIRSTVEIRESGYDGHIPMVLSSMIAWQRRIPSALLRLGVFSKTAVFFHFLFHSRKLA
jgi:hypothetical protein